MSPLVAASRAMADTGVKPRLLCIHIEHGPGGMDGAIGTEHNFTFKPWLAPLQPIRDHVTLVDGVFGTWWGNAHSVSYAHLLTGSANPKGGAPRTPSVDRYLNKKLGPGQISPLNLVTRYNFYAGGRGLVYDGSNSMARQSAEHAVGAQSRLLSNIAGVSADAAKLKALKDKRKRILDEVAGELKTLNSRLSIKEQLLVNNFMESINTTASNLGLVGQAQTGGACQRPSKYPKNQAPPSGQSHFEHVVDAQFNNIITAFACNLTQYGVMSFGEVPDSLLKWTDSTGKDRTGMPCTGQGFHTCVAHYGSQDARLCFEASVAWYMNKIAQLAQKMDKIKEANGRSLLENTIIVIGGEVGDGNHLRGRKAFVIVGGRGAPKLRTGRYIKIPVQSNLSLKGTPDGDLNIRDKVALSQRSEADVWREICFAMGDRNIKTFGMPYLNRGKVGLM